MGNKLDAVMWLFCNHRKHKESISLPVRDGNFIVATDGIILISAPVRHFEKQYEDITDGFPNYKAVIPMSAGNVLFQTDSKELRDIAGKLLHKNEYTPCKRCEGNGNLYTHNRHEVGCDKCDGTGNAEHLGWLIGVPTWEDADPGEKGVLFTINGVRFNPNYMENIARVGILLGKPIVWDILEKDKTCALFIGDVMILMMPVEYTEEDKSKYCGELIEIEIPVSSI